MRTIFGAYCKTCHDRYLSEKPALHQSCNAIIWAW